MVTTATSQQQLNMIEFALADMLFQCEQTQNLLRPSM